GADAGTDPQAAPGTSGHRASRIPEHGDIPRRMSTFALMAGGTGGHLFPAMALAQELRRRGHAIHLITDHRVGGYGGSFPAEAVHVVPWATPSVRNTIGFGVAGMRVLGGIVVVWGRLQRISPDAVVGFGGYPVYPAFVAASLARIPGVLHE